MRRYRALSAAAFAVVVSALVGGLYGRSALATDEAIPDYYKTFSAALSAVQTQYVGHADPDRLVYGAIRGMLGTLDPHSSFFDPREYAQMRERQEGHYYGIGVSIVAAQGSVTAVQVFEGSPAYRAGMRRGDVIARIAGDDAKGWTVEQAMQRLRGQRGTPVKIQIRRPGYADLIPIDLVRDEVLMSTVPAAFMIDRTTGYVWVKEFGENTDQELHAALSDLKAKGMQRLLFDLRNNPGGALDQAIKVVNEFIPKGEMVVYTRGRIRNSDSDYRATEAPAFADIPIVELDNRSSASASEIVTGALQDHDRAYIVGETTFGKALVQSIYRISDGAGLALTTAHYYTPSGRLIQRPWDATFDEYLQYTQKDQDVPRPHLPSELKYTDAGRPVYSGGGIDPDRRINGAIDGFDPTEFGRLLYARQDFATFAEKFSATGDDRIKQTPTGRVFVSRGFDVTDAMVDDFRSQLTREGLKIDDASFTKDLPFIKAEIRYEIDSALFGLAEARRRLIEVDPQAQLGLTLFGEARRLADLSKGASKAAN